MTSLEIEAFLTVQQTGSVTKAAEQLYISQSSLSTRLRTLERELGCSLFTRGRGDRAMLLTSEGERFLPLAQQHKDLEEKMRTLARDAMPRRVLRTASFSSIGNCLLPPVFQRFARCYPDIRLEITDIIAPAATNAIIRDELDIAFSTLSISTEHITSIPFLLEPMTFLCAANSNYPDTVALQDLSTANEVYSHWCADVQQWHQATFGADAEPKVRLELMSQIRLFTAQPDAWAIVPYSVAKDLQNAPDLRRCEMDFSVPERCSYILCNRKTRDSEPVIRFLECLRSVLQENNMPGLLL